jgi:hypothetical protein
MKRHFLALIASVLLLSLSAWAQDKKETLWINETSHDFGKIPQGKPVYTHFELKGLGDSLKLEMVQAGC